MGLLSYPSVSYNETWYMSPREFAADYCIHVLGLAFGAAGSVTLVARIATGAQHGNKTAIAVYIIGLLAMLGCSAAYNLAPPSPIRLVLRRFDQAAIFLMIAGTYTPFTTRDLDGSLAVTLTSFIWIVALLGAAGKLVLPRRLDRLSVVIYLMLGWIVLVAFGPLMAGLAPLTIHLLLAGGVLYTVGIGFYLWRMLPFQNAIWHGFVLAAAGCHYAAILQRGAS